jgi:hypothetical protein
LPRDALAAGGFDKVIRRALIELAKHRPLQSLDIRLRAATQPPSPLVLTANMAKALLKAVGRALKLGLIDDEAAE